MKRKIKKKSKNKNKQIRKMKLKEKWKRKLKKYMLIIVLDTCMSIINYQNINNSGIQRFKINIINQSQSMIPINIYVIKHRKKNRRNKKKMINPKVLKAIKYNKN